MNIAIENVKKIVKAKFEKVRELYPDKKISLEKVLKKIKKIAPKDMAADNLAEMLLYPMEEIGEVAQCIATEKGLKNKNIKEPTHIECVDVIIGMLGIYFLSGGTIEELPELIDKKSDKWKKRVEKYHVCS